MGVGGVVVVVSSSWITLKDLIYWKFWMKLRKLHLYMVGMVVEDDYF